MIAHRHACTPASVPQKWPQPPDTHKPGQDH